MPRSVLEVVDPDHVGPALGMGEVIAELAREPLVGLNAGQEHDGAGDMVSIDPMELPARGVDLSCPSCGGALQEVEVGRMSRFRCRVGHVFSPRSLLGTKESDLEAGLWAAVRTLDEHAAVASRLADRSRSLGSPITAARFERRQADSAQRADLIRGAIAGIGEIQADGEEPRAVDEARRVAGA
jgi:two-component system chemotaxis response regulator CheB